MRAVHSERSGTVLKSVCSFCGCDLGEADGRGVDGISGSICGTCWYEQYVFKLGGVKPALYSGNEESMKTWGRLALERRERWERLVLAKTIIYNGCLAALTKSRVGHACAQCAGTIWSGELYYSVIVGKGLGAVKYPDRVHSYHIGRYLEGYAPSFNEENELYLERKIAAQFLLRGESGND